MHQSSPYRFLRVLLLWLTPALLHAQTYKWDNVPIGGGGYVTGIVAHPTEPNLRYIRTDVGGIYRWDQAARRWIPLLDFLNPDQRYFYGCDGFALAPSDPNVIYAYLGMYDWDPAQLWDLWKSTDRGQTWTRTNLNKRAGGNQQWRWNGESIAVDPNNANVVYVGTRYDGLYKTTDGGGTWAPVSSVPTSPDNEGVRTITIDKASGKIYVGAKDEGVYVSSDGNSFTKIIGSPARPNRMTVTGSTLYVTAENGVFKFDGSNWTTISPEAGDEFNSLAVDPSDPNHVVVTRLRYGFNNRIYETTNGGSTWRRVSDNVSVYNHVPWHPSAWFNSATAQVLFDPFNPKRLFMVDWYTIWRTDDITQAKPYFENDPWGHEELVEFDLACPPSGAVLLHGGADVSGLKHFNLTQYPSIKFPKQETTGLDFCQTQPNYMARVASEGAGASGHTFEVSTNQGESWTARALPGRNGRLAYSATDVNNLFWFPGPVGPPKYTKDGGNTWTNSAGLPNMGGDGNGFWTWAKPIASDRVNGSKFYAFHNGSFYRSTDGGATFSATVTNLPNGGGFRIVKTAYNTEGEALIALDGNGLYHSSNSGTSFTKINFFQRALLCSYGKAINGNVPTMFVMGVVGGQWGVYRSTDLGANWTKISVPEKQLGDDPNSMEGDLQVAGRVYIGSNGRGIYFGESTETVSTNAAPTGAIISPTNTSTFAVGTTIPISATATDSDGSVAKVEFFNGGTKLGEDNTAPYTFDLTNAALGDYFLVARITDNGGATGNSPAVNIRVIDPNAAPPSPTTATIGFTASPPATDGSLDAVWNGATETAITKTILGTVTNAADLSGGWRAVWDANKLYVLVDVKDNSLKNDSEASYNDDGVEVYVDGNNEKAPSYDANDAQYVFPWNDPDFEAYASANPNAKNGVTRTIVNTATGYRVVVSIPWATIGANVGDTKKIGLDVHINDDDDGGDRDKKKSWVAPEDQAWNNPSLFGTVTLTGGPPIVVPPASCAGNLLANPGFEEGKTAYTIFPDANAVTIVTDAASGTAAAKISGAVYGLAQQSLVPDATKQYILRGKAKRTGSPGTSHLALNFRNSSYQTIIEYTAPVTTTGYGDYVVGPVAVPAGAIEVLALAYCDPGGDLFVDELCLTTVASTTTAPPATCDNNLLQNAGFENGKTGYTLTPGDNALTIVTDAVSGTAAGQVNGDVYGDIRQLVSNLDPTKQYVLKARMKRTGSPYYAVLEMDFQGPNGSVEKRGVDVTSGTYADYTVGPFAVPTGATGVFAVVGVGGPGSTIVVDELCLSAVASTTTTPPATCENNKIQNPGFENGKTGYSLTPGDNALTIVTDAVSGTAAGQVNGDVYGDIRQMFTNIDPAKQYVLRARAKRTGSPYYAVIELDFRDGSGNKVQQFGKDITSITYADYTVGPISVPAGATTVYAVAGVGGPGSTIVLDEFCLTEVQSTTGTPVATCEGNLVTNASFEQDITGYNVAPASGGHAIVNDPASGQKAVQVIGSAYGYVWQVFTPNPTKQYILKAKAKRTGTLNFGTISLNFRNSSYQTIVEPSVSVTATAYGEYIVGPVSVPAGAIEVLAGIYADGSGSLTVDDLCLTAIESQTVNQAPTVANAIASQTATVGQPFSLAIPANTFADDAGAASLTLTASGLPNGLSFNGTTISGTPSTTGVSSVTITATDAGSLSVSTGFSLTVNGPVSSTAAFAITGVTTVSCQTLTADQRSVTFTPQYSGLNGQPVTFSVLNETLPTTNAGPYTLRLYTDNPTVTLKASQPGTPGEVSFRYNWLTACNSGTATPANQAPTVSNAIPNQTAVQNQPFSFVIPANTFADDAGVALLTLTATGLPNGLSFNGTTISGTASTTGASTITVKATDTGGLSVSTQFALTVNAPSSTTGSAAFALTGVTTVSCQTLTADQRSVTFTPQYSGLNGQPVTFSVLNETLPTTNAGPYTLRLYTDNPTVTLKASQPGTPGEVSFTYNWLTACNSGTATPGNQAPTVANAIPNQTATVGQPFSFVIPANTFADDAGAASLTLTASGLPNGLSFNGTTISGTVSTTGASTITVKATDTGGLSVSTQFTLTVNPASTTGTTGFAITGVTTLSCVTVSPDQRSVTFTPQYSGLNGQPITFSVLNESVPTTNAGPYTLRLYTDNPAVTLKASQQGTPGEVSFRYNWLAACNAASGGARLSGTEPGLNLKAEIYPNPVTDEVTVAIEGASGQRVQMQLTNANGQPVADRAVDVTSSRQIERLPMYGQSAGLYLLRVSTNRQSVTLKVVKE